MPTHLHIIHGCFHTELEELWQELSANAKIFTIWPFTRKQQQQQQKKQSLV
jgi:hypothetical protein